MTDRRFPARVMLSCDSACNSVCDAPCLSSSGNSRLTNMWWFCGSDGLLRRQDVSLTHCHLFSVQQLAASHRQHVPVRETLNGKTRCSLCQQHLLLDTTQICDDVQLATVGCSYAIPSSVESLDLAVSCLQRMSGSYYMNHNMPCLMSVCCCDIQHGQRAMTENEEQPSGDGLVKNCRRKLPTTCVSDSLYCTSTGSGQTQQQQQRCTRSTSKQLMDVSCEEDADRHMLACVDTDHSLQLSDHCPETSDKLEMTPKTSRCNAADGERMLLKTVATNARRSLAKYRRQRQQKVIAKKKRTRHSSRTTLTCQLRSHTMSLSLTSRHIMTDHRQSSQLTAVNECSGRVKVRKSSQNAAVNGDSNGPLRSTVHQQATRKQRVDAAVPVRCRDGSEMKSAAEPLTRSPIVNGLETDGEVAELSALSVDVSFDHDDVCSSPTSPLPVHLKMTESDQCNDLLQQAALLLSRKRFVFSPFTVMHRILMTDNGMFCLVYISGDGQLHGEAC